MEEHLDMACKLLEAIGADEMTRSRIIATTGGMTEVLAKRLKNVHEMAVAIEILALGSRAIIKEICEELSISGKD